MNISHFFAILAIFGNVLLGVLGGAGKRTRRALGTKVFLLLAGANVTVCINLQTTPSQKFTVSFDPRSGANRCMIDIGAPATVDVTQSGLTCAYIGYVEAKESSSGGDTCLTDESIWNIAFSTSGLPNNKSGSISSEWSRPIFSQTNEVWLKSYPTGSEVCGSAALCNSTECDWPSGTKGPVYVSQ